MLEYKFALELAIDGGVFCDCSGLAIIAPDSTANIHISDPAEWHWAIEQIFLDCFEKGVSVCRPVACVSDYWKMIERELLDTHRARINELFRDAMLEAA